MKVYPPIRIDTSKSLKQVKEDLQNFPDYLKAQSSMQLINHDEDNVNQPQWAYKLTNGDTFLIHTLSPWIVKGKRDLELKVSNIFTFVSDNFQDMLEVDFLIKEYFNQLKDYECPLE